MKGVTNPVDPMIESWSSWTYDYDDWLKVAIASGSFGRGPSKGEKIKFVVSSFSQNRKKIWTSLHAQLQALFLQQ